MVRGNASSQRAGRPAEREERMSEPRHPTQDQRAGVPPPAPKPTAAGVPPPDPSRTGAAADELEDLDWRTLLDPESAVPTGDPSRADGPAHRPPGGPDAGDQPRAARATGAAAAA